MISSLKQVLVERNCLLAFDGQTTGHKEGTLKLGREATCCLYKIMLVSVAWAGRKHLDRGRVGNI